MRACLFLVCILSLNLWWCTALTLPAVKSCTSGTPSGDVCGTIAGLQCPSNYTCVTDPMIADDDGICCPKTVVNFVQVTLSIYSGRLDPVFNVFNSNVNFTAIVTTAKTHPLGHLASILGYRGFQVTLFSHGGSRVFTIGKCADSSFEKQLLDTVAQLPDTQGGRLLPSIVQQVESNIRACGQRVTYMVVKLSIYSGRSDPQFSIYSGNANFTSIAASTATRTSTPLAGILGYRGFEVDLFFQAQPGFKSVTVGKCTDQALEYKLLETVAQLRDSSGHHLQPSIVQFIANELQGCAI